MNKVCPSTLAEGYKTYSPVALKNLFGGKRVSHQLNFLPPQLDEQVAAAFRNNRKTLSISGVQVKQSLLLDNNKLRLTEEKEQGSFILKPIPHREILSNVEELPANEHLTMQVAKQVYGIATAENGLVFFQNGEPAYLTKRFDRASDGIKIHQEDFAVLLGRSPQKNGEIFKNEGSYEEMAEVIQKAIPASIIELEKFYQIVLFNYLFCNGDAHLKNFSIQMTPNGDYKLTPAYDLINTKIHLPDDTAMALNDGLFKNEYSTASFDANGFYAYDDFYEFGLKIGLKERRMLKILGQFQSRHILTEQLIANSFLQKEMQRLYLDYYLDRLRALNYSFKNTSSS